MTSVSTLNFNYQLLYSLEMPKCKLSIFLTKLTSCMFCPILMEGETLTYILGVEKLDIIPYTPGTSEASKRLEVGVENH